MQERELQKQRLEEKEAKKKEKLERRKHREEKRRLRRFLKKQEDDPEMPIDPEDELSIKIAKEERKLMIAQRKLESIRLMNELFERIKVCLHDYCYHSIDCLIYYTITLTPSLAVI